MMTDPEEFDYDSFVHNSLVGRYAAEEQSLKAGLRREGWVERAVLAGQIFDREQEFRLQLKYNLTSERGNGILFGLQMARDIVAGEA